MMAVIFRSSGLQFLLSLLRPVPSVDHSQQPAAAVADSSRAGSARRRRPRRLRGLVSAAVAVSVGSVCWSRSPHALRRPFSAFRYAGQWTMCRYSVFQTRYGVARRSSQSVAVVDARVVGALRGGLFQDEHMERTQNAVVTTSPFLFSSMPGRCLAPHKLAGRRFVGSALDIETANRIWTGDQPSSLVSIASLRA